MPTKHLFESKTFWVNALMLLIYLLQWTGLATIIPASWNAEIPSVIAAVNILLRYLTNSAVTLKV